MFGPPSSEPPSLAVMRCAGARCHYIIVNVCITRFGQPKPRADLVASYLGVAQRVELDAHQATREIEELILARSRELLRGHDLALS